MAEQYPYHPSEHYAFPHDPIEQAEEELRLYDTPYEFQESVEVLKSMYQWTACFKSLEQYAVYAADLRPTPPDEVAVRSGFNEEFFSGALMATHVNVAPAPLTTKRTILNIDFLAGIDQSPEKDAIEQSIKEWLDGWAGGETDNWAEFLAEQDVRYQAVATALAERMFEGRENALERELDFLVGFTFASNIVWQAARRSEKYVR